MSTSSWFGITMAASIMFSICPASAASQSADRIAIAGGWTLNKEASDQPPERSNQGAERGGGDNSGRRGGGRRGGGGGFGGGYGRGGGMGRGGGTRGNPEEMARMRDVMRDLTTASDHLVITQTDSMIVITSADGRTTRLSADGKKIKDDNTGVERKTKWDGGKLVSEISGLGAGGKATQTFAADPESHQLRITVQLEGGGRSSQSRSFTHVYDNDKFTK